MRLGIDLVFVGRTFRAYRGNWRKGIVWLPGGEKKGGSVIASKDDLALVRRKFRLYCDKWVNRYAKRGGGAGKTVNVSARHFKDNLVTFAERWYKENDEGNRTIFDLEKTLRPSTFVKTLVYIKEAREIKGWERLGLYSMTLTGG